MRRIAPIAAVLALLLAGAAPAGASTKLPARFFGTGGWAFPSDATLAQLSRQHLRTWRLTFSWTDAGYAPGRPAQLSGYDRVMRAASADGVEVLATVTGCPKWACPMGGPPSSPAALAGFQDFVRAAVERYKPGGSLGLRVPIRYWQVLNEVNGSDQWPPAPSAAGYASLLKATATTIRGADPKAKVVLAGLGEKMTVWLRDYLPALYAQPGFRASFDVMAPEGYAIRTRDVPRILDVTRRIMRRNGDAAKPMFITEMSWASAGPEHPYVVGPGAQASYLKRSWTQLDAAGRVPAALEARPCLLVLVRRQGGHRDGLLGPAQRPRRRGRRPEARARGLHDDAAEALLRPLPRLTERQRPVDT